MMVAYFAGQIVLIFILINVFIPSQYFDCCVVRPSINSKIPSEELPSEEVQDKFCVIIMISSSCLTSKKLKGFFSIYMDVSFIATFCSMKWEEILDEGGDYFAYGHLLLIAMAMFYLYFSVVNLLEATLRNRRLVLINGRILIISSKGEKDMLFFLFNHQRTI